MPPKKKEVQKFSLGEFMTDNNFGGSWADEVEETFESGTQRLPPVERRGGSGTGYGGDRGGYHTLRDNVVPQKLPDKPPFTAHLGNLSFDATVETVTDFFSGCDVTSIRIIEDREQQRPKGFAYAEFANVDGLKSALALDGQSFQGRTIRIKVADPPRERHDRPESTRDLSDWTRKGPLADLPSRGGSVRRGPGMDFAERRPPRDSPADDGKVRDFGNWERRGPLSPLPQPDKPVFSRDASRHRGDGVRSLSESMRGSNRRASPAAWGPSEGHQQDGSCPPRRDFSDRPERAPTAAELDPQWRKSMLPDPPASTVDKSREGSEAPSSPAAAPPAGPATRPKLQLAKRTVSDNVDSAVPVTSATDSKSNPFGAARPIDTAARERAIEEKRLAALQEKKETEKAKKERRLAKEAAAAQEAAEKVAAAAEAESAPQQTESHEAKPVEAPAAQQPQETAETKTAEAEAKPGQQPDQKADQKSVHKFADCAREGPPLKLSRAIESGNWRQPASNSRPPQNTKNYPTGPRRGGGGGPPRGPRHDGGRPPAKTNGNGPPSTPGPDEEGWTTVPLNKGRRGGRAMAA